jgi:hypothetical protein
MRLGGFRAWLLRRRLSFSLRVRRRLGSSFYVVLVLDGGVAGVGCVQSAVSLA